MNRYSSTNIIRKILILTLSTIVIICLAINVPSAKSITKEMRTNVSVTGGTIHVHSSMDRVLFERNSGSDYASAKAGDLTIVDATGTGNGWTLTVKSKPIIETSTNDEIKDFHGGLLLETNNATIRGKTGSATKPNWKHGGAFSINNKMPLKVLHAKEGEGMGSYKVRFGNDSLKMQIPEHAIHNEENLSYQTTLVWNIISGP
ncbi:WxL domain-containing protein [Bacillus shivajii]|uniref:WxL domain-containing protein n=1 Tax=Bacillus shivajii TaxID=1983719 RepID=UPI001CFBA297|nr:WxL domain-containing protein [Bacillus shivajii]UCZ52144.1 WxL domain-containing protein [Bacillus shivajii]